MFRILCFRRAISNPIVDREEATRIGNVLLVSQFAQNLPTSAPTRRRAVLVAPKIHSQQVALVLVFKEWGSRMEITAPLNAKATAREAFPPVEEVALPASP